MHLNTFLSSLLFAHVCRTDLLLLFFYTGKFCVLQSVASYLAKTIIYNIYAMYIVYMSTNNHNSI